MRNDIEAVLSQIFNTTYDKHQRHSRIQPGKDKKNNIQHCRCYLIDIGGDNEPFQPEPSLLIFESFAQEIISLRTSHKRLPGRELAIYSGAMFAILVLSYNLARHRWFIRVSDKASKYVFLFSS